jgi:hypothetical protein
LDVDVLAAASQLVAQPWLPPLLLPWRSPSSQTLRLLLSALQVLKWPLWLLLSFQLSYLLSLPALASQQAQQPSVLAL